MSNLYYDENEFEVDHKDMVNDVNNMNNLSNDTSHRVKYKDMAREVNAKYNQGLEVFGIDDYAATASDDWGYYAKKALENNPLPKIDDKTKAQVDEYRKVGEFSFGNMFSRWSQADDMAEMQTALSDINYKMFIDTATDEDRKKQKEYKEKLYAYNVATARYGTLDKVMTSPVNLFEQLIEGGTLGLERALQFGTIGAGVGSVVPGLGTGAGASTGAAIGFAGGYAEYSYQQIAGDTFVALMEQKDKDGNTLDEDTARAIATITGVLGAGLETAAGTVGAKAVAPITQKMTSMLTKEMSEKIFKALADKNIRNVLGKEGVAAIRDKIGFETVKNFGKAVGAEITQENAQTAMQFGAEELGRAIQGGEYEDAHGVNELFDLLADTTKETFFTIALPFGLGATSKGYIHHRESKRHVNENNELKRAMDSEEVKKRPYTAQEQLRKEFENGNGGDMRYSYFQAEDIAKALYTDEKGIRLAYELGLDPETLKEAIENDMPVSIETEKAGTLLYANDKYKHLADVAKFDPMDMSREEVEAYDSKYGEYTQEMEFAEGFANDVINEATKDVDRTQTDVLADSLVPDIVQTGMDEEKARHHARIFSSFAQIIAPKLGESPESFLSRLTIAGKQHFDENGNSSVYIDYGMGKRKVYGQPVNDDVDVDVPVEVVMIESRFTGKNEKVLRKRFPKDIEKEVLSAFEKGIVNEDTGKIISMSKNDFHEQVKFEDKDIINGLLQLEAVIALPELMQKAKIVESYDDTKNNPNIKQMHRFQAALRIEGKDYSVKLTVKEFKDGTLHVDTENPIKLYHHRLEKELFTGNSDTLLSPDVNRPSANSSNTYTLRKLIEDVNDHTKKQLFINEDGTVNYKKDVHNQTYYQEPNRKVRGSIAFDKEADKSFITLFEDNKNMSTLLHETGHFFLESLKKAYDMQEADAWVKENFEILARELDFDPKAEISNETHERFARMTEAYFMEGKAPKEELQGAFKAFKNWLTRIYRTATKLLGKDKLNDEIRGVFDRLLATEEEIAQTQRKAEKENAVKQLVEVFGLSKEQADLLQKEQVKANKKASALILLNKIQGLKDAEENAKANLRDIIGTSDFYNSIRTISNKKINFASVLGFLEENTANNLREKWSGLFDNEKGMSLDEAGGYFNTSAEQFLNLLFTQIPEKEYRRQYIAKAKADFEEKFNTGIEYAGMSEEVQNLEIELLGGQKADMEQLNTAAMERASRKDGEILDRDFVRLQKAIAKKNLVLKDLINSRKKEEIVWTKEQLRTLRANLKATYETKMQRDKTVRAVRKELKSKSVPEAFRQQILRFTDMIKGLTTSAQHASPDTKPWSEFKKDLEAGNTNMGFSMIAPPVPEWLENLNEPIRLSELSYADLKDLSRAVQSIAHIGRKQVEIGKGIEKRKVTEQVHIMTEPMKGLHDARQLTEKQQKSWLGSKFLLAQEALDSMVLLRQEFLRADGYTEEGKGPNTTFIIDKLHTAQSTEAKLLMDFQKKLSKILRPIARGKDFTKEFVIEGVNLPEALQRRWGGKFNKERVFSIALNLGNEGNMRALLEGYDWTLEDVGKIVSTMSKEDLEAVQQIWDMLEELKPMVAETYKAMNGVNMEEVKAVPLVVKAKDGEAVHLRGGYYPLQFDPELAPHIARANEIDNILNANSYLPAKPTVRKGMTINRTGSTKPPLLSFLTVMNTHIPDSIKYATHAEAISDIYKIISHPDYEVEFTKKFGAGVYKQILPWLRACASNDRMPVVGFEKILNGLITRGSLYAMGLSLRTAVMQFTSVGSSIKQAGFASFLNGCYITLTKRGKVYEDVCNKSAYFSMRAKTFDKTVSDELTRFDPNKTALRVGKYVITREQYCNACFALTQAADLAVALPTWIAKYNAEIKKGTDEQTAITRADECVILAQGSGLTMDTTQLMRDKKGMSLLLMFMSFAMNWQNRQRFYISGYREHLRGGNSEIGSKEFFSHIALEWVMPVVLTVLMNSMREDEYDWEELPGDLMEEGASYFLMGWPILRDMYSIAGYGSEFGETMASKGFKVAKKAYEGIEKEIEGKNSREQSYITMQHVINTAGFFAKVPTNSFFRTYDGTMEWLEGDAGFMAVILGKPYKK